MRSWRGGSGDERSWDGGVVLVAAAAAVEEEGFGALVYVGRGFIGVVGAC